MRRRRVRGAYYYYDVRQMRMFIGAAAAGTDLARSDKIAALRRAARPAPVGRTPATSSWRGGNAPARGRCPVVARGREAGRRAACGQR